MVDDRILPFLDFTRLGQHVDAILVTRQPPGQTDPSDRRQTSKVDANAYGDLARLCLADDLFDLRPVPDIAGIQPQAVHSALEGLESELVVKVDVGNQRYRDLTPNLREGLRRLHVRHRTANDLATGLLQSPDLGDGGFDVTSVRLGHRLYADRSITSDLHVADLEILRFLT